MELDCGGTKGEYIANMILAEEVSVLVDGLSTDNSYYTGWQGFFQDFEWGSQNEI